MGTKIFFNYTDYKRERDVSRNLLCRRQPLRRRMPRVQGATEKSDPQERCGLRVVNGVTCGGTKGSS